MNLKDLEKEYDKLQEKYGAGELTSIYNGGCSENPEICFVFMNPTGRNIASSKTWTGPKSPWIGTKNIWDLFYAVNLLDEEIYQDIKKYKPSDWTVDFSKKVYEKYKDIIKIKSCYYNVAIIIASSSIELFINSNKSFMQL